MYLKTITMIPLFKMTISNPKLRTRFKKKDSDKLLIKVRYKMRIKLSLILNFIEMKSSLNLSKKLMSLNMLKEKVKVKVDQMIREKTVNKV